jgi:hypothetical protein
MARTSNKTKDTPEVKNPEAKNPELENPELENPEAKNPELENPELEKETPEVEIPEHVEKLMKLYPQYEQLYVTPNGFVHPVGSPKYLVANATLYKNKFYNNK